MKKIKIGIDASRNRSGGAQIHTIGILENFNQKKFSNLEIHLWSYPQLLDKIPNFPWLKKHSVFNKKVSLWKEVIWQNRELPKILKIFKIDILLNTSAGSVCYFKPSITMSRDMLSYEKNIINKSGFSLYRIRLILLKYIQKESLTRSQAAIFLTQYAADEIQKFTGKIKNYKIIHHGISEKFRNYSKKISNKKKVKCVYVSNIDFYKNHTELVTAFLALNDKNLHLLLVGGIGNGKPGLNATKSLGKTLDKLDPHRKNVTIVGSVDHNMLPDFLSNCDLFIFGSSCENMPNTLVEGMASGLPILSSNRGPMPEILKDGGLYFDPENIDSTYDALKTMIYDQEAQKKFAKKSLERSMEFSWEKCSEETFSYLIDTFNNYR